MNLFSFLVLLAYVLFFAAVLLVLYRVFLPPIGVERPLERSDRWWPWPITSYNYWPSWKGGVGCSSGCSNQHMLKQHHQPHHQPHHQQHHQQHHQHSRPWGGSGRGANAGGFHSSSTHGHK